VLRLTVVGGDSLVAPSDRASTVWLGRVTEPQSWEAVPMPGVVRSLASSGDRVFLVAKRRLYTLHTESRAVGAAEMVGAVNAVCAQGSQVLAMGGTRRGAEAWLSTDGGETFTAKPIGGASTAHACALSADGWRWVVTSGIFAGEVWVAAPGGAFVSRAVPAPRVEAIAVDPRDGRHAWIGMWGEGVVRTRDGGVSWQSMGLKGFEVTSLVVDFARGWAYAGAGSGVYVRSLP
jgi:hypothetical protein